MRSRRLGPGVALGLGTAVGCGEDADEPDGNGEAGDSTPQAASTIAAALPPNTRKKLRRVSGAERLMR
jgi:hypothetical protein